MGLEGDPGNPRFVNTKVRRSSLTPIDGGNSEISREDASIIGRETGDGLASCPAGQVTVAARASGGSECPVITRNDAELRRRRQVQYF
ncbi:hypothetical protein BO71DRAFT_394811 [Aspergillus ellipticus CBS 707.79]|uniref:Uncharacterized protein n=1 Tax=Aspergillus ellipticus CBS 707.79 TaxID=1448320 RepID=A0A319DMS9_9EURO|nr:hypothetical protein BO71DRAFT_394811 [Aspergillus ellipticus CBS 707.79]